MVKNREGTKRARVIRIESLRKDKEKVMMVFWVTPRFLTRTLYGQREVR